MSCANSGDVSYTVLLLCVKITALVGVLLSGSAERRETQAVALQLFYPWCRHLRLLYSQV